MGRFAAAAIYEESCGTAVPAGGKVARGEGGLAHPRRTPRPNSAAPPDLTSARDFCNATLASSRPNEAAALGGGDGWGKDHGNMASTSNGSPASYWPRELSTRPRGAGLVCPYRRLCLAGDVHKMRNGHRSQNHQNSNTHQKIHERQFVISDAHKPSLSNFQPYGRQFQCQTLAHTDGLVIGQPIESKHVTLMP